MNWYMSDVSTLGNLADLSQYFSCVLLATVLNSVRACNNIS